jgi:hypothetical protein
MAKTILICIIFDLFFMTLLPLFSLKWMAVSITQIVIIFLSFTIGYSWLPYGILALQMSHGLFSLEGWALGTLIGTLFCLLMIRLKALVQITGPLSTIITTYIIQLVWCIVAGVLTSIKNNDWKFFQLFFNQGLTYGLITALISPFIFFMLRKIWLVPTNPFDEEN